MEILSVSHDYSIWVIMLFIVFVAFLLTLGFFEGKDKDNTPQMVACSLLAIAVFFGGIAFCSHMDNKNILKVIITDYNKVDFNKYNITGNEGKIVELTEK